MLFREMKSRESKEIIISSFYNHGHAEMSLSSRVLAFAVNGIASSWRSVRSYWYYDEMRYYVIICAKQSFIA